MLSIAIPNGVHLSIQPNFPTRKYKRITVSFIKRLRPELGQMERFLDLLHTAINDSREQLTVSIEENASTMSEDERQEYYEAYAEDFSELKIIFHDCFFSSFVVSWYSFMESHLTSVCKSRKLKIVVSFEDKERFGDGIQRAHKFLHRGVRYEIDTKHWTELNQIKELRNIIVHNQGRLHYSPYDASPKSIPLKLDDDVLVYFQIEEYLFRYLQTNNLFKPTGLFYFTPTLEYCRHLVKFGEEFFVKLHNDFRKKSGD